MRPTLCLSLLVLSAALAFAGDADSVNCDSLDGWTLLDGTGGAARAELSLGQPREGAGSVRLRYERVAGKACALIHAGLLTGLRRLRMEVRVERSSMLLVSVTDRDQARFHHVVRVEAGDWRSVSVAPEGFTIADDSPVKKERLDPALRIDLSLRACDEVMWGLISAPGSDVVVTDTRFAAAGITLWGKDRIAGLRNGEAGMTTRLGLTDRKLELSGCTVEVWNVYAAPNSQVTLEGCRLGEVWSFGNADLTLLDSECDGRGGYVKAQDESTFRLVGCTLDAEVIAQGKARMRLERCTLKRNLSASDAARVTLAGSRVLGAVQRLGAGKVEDGE